MNKDNNVEGFFMIASGASEFATLTNMTPSRSVTKIQLRPEICF